MTSRPAASLRLALLAGSLVLSPWGGANAAPVSAGQYMSAVCGGFSEFTAALQTRSSQVRPPAPDAPASEVKRAVRMLLDTLIGDTDRLIARLSAAGVPSVAQGQSVAEAIVAAGGRIRAMLADARDRAEQLPEGPEQFPSAAQTLMDSIRRTGVEIAEATRELGRQEELERAAEQEPACRSLSRS